jgi:hypothetical protein
MALPEVKEILNSKDKSFDMVIVYVDFTCCEVGYYLAEHFNTPLVLFSTFQTSWSYVNWAMGQTHNPAYQAMDLLDLKVKGKGKLFHPCLTTMYVKCVLDYVKDDTNYCLICRYELLAKIYEYCSQCTCSTE